MLEHNCPFCDYHVQRKGFLSKHISNKHANDQDRICPFCFQAFSNKYNCKRHTDQNCVATSSPTTKVFVCNGCTKPCASKQSLQRHVATCKGVANPLECPHCHKTFAHASTKSRHLKICKQAPAPMKDFGYESLDHISPTFMESCINDFQTGVCKMVDAIYFNPENRSFKPTPSNKSDVVLILKNNTWLPENIDNVVHAMISRASKVLFEYYEFNNSLQEEDKRQHSGLLLRSLANSVNKKSESYISSKKFIIKRLCPQLL